jgi:exodeoxyribonuclease VIII
MNNSLLNNLSDEEYKGIDAINFSAFKHFLVSPKHYQSYLSQKQEETPAMRIGTAVHSLCLEPQKWDTEWAVCPEVDRRTTAGKAMYAAFLEMSEGKKTLLSQEAILAHDVANSVRSNKFFKKVTSGNVKVESVAVASFAGSNIKGRIDIYNEDLNICADIKTFAEIPTIDNIRRQIVRSMYNMQAAFYVRLIEHVYGKTPTFVFIFVEKQAPYSVALVEVSRYWIEHSLEEIEKGLCRYENCKASNIWNGLENENEPIVLRMWDEVSALDKPFKNPLES